MHVAAKSVSSLRIAALVVLQEFRLEDLWLLILDKLHCPLGQRPLDPGPLDQLDSKKGRLRGVAFIFSKDEAHFDIFLHQLIHWLIWKLGLDLPQDHIVVLIQKLIKSLKMADVSNVWD